MTNMIVYCIINIIINNMLKILSKQYRSSEDRLISIIVSKYISTFSFRNDTKFSLLIKRLKFKRLLTTYLKLAVFHTDNIVPI